MIRDFVKRESLLVNADVENWEAAVEKVGELLLNIGAIEEKYIQAMINKVHELGSYIVIAPQIAMPHARPEDGAKETNFALITLKNGINFGHEKNDPVKLVIGLAATDSNLHIEALAELMELLGTEGMLEKIISSKSEDELYSYLQ